MSGEVGPGLVTLFLTLRCWSDGRKEAENDWFLIVALRPGNFAFHPAWLLVAFSLTCRSLTPDNWKHFSIKENKAFIPVWKILGPRCICVSCHKSLMRPLTPDSFVAAAVFQLLLTRLPQGKGNSSRWCLSEWAATAHLEFFLLYLNTGRKKTRA